MQAPSDTLFNLTLLKMMENIISYIELSISMGLEGIHL